MALELDKDDSVIRRRLRQKMEFMTDAEVEALQPMDADDEECRGRTVFSGVIGSVMILNGSHRSERVTVSVHSNVTIVLFEYPTSI